MVTELFRAEKGHWGILIHTLFSVCDCKTSRRDGDAVNDVFVVIHVSL